MAQEHYCHIHLALLQSAVLPGQGYGVFFFNMDVIIIRYDAKHGHTAELFKHAAAVVEQAQVAAELIDDDALDQLAVLLGLQGYAAVDRGEDAAAVDVANKDDVGAGMARHGQVYQVVVTEIEFRNAACALHDDGVVAGVETVESIADLAAEIDCFPTLTRHV